MMKNGRRGVKRRSWPLDIPIPPFKVSGLTPSSPPPPPPEQSAHPFICFFFLLLLLLFFFFFFLKKYTSMSQILDPPSIGEYWNIFGVPVLPENVIFETFFRMCWVIQKLSILEHKNGLVMSNTCVITGVPVSGTWSIPGEVYFFFFFSPDILQ